MQCVTPTQWGSPHTLQGPGGHSGSRCAIHTWHINTYSGSLLANTDSLTAILESWLLPWGLHRMPESCPKGCKGWSWGCRYDLDAALYLDQMWFQSSNLYVSIWKLFTNIVSCLWEEEALLLSIFRYHKKASWQLVLKTPYREGSGHTPAHAWPLLSS